MAVRPAKPGEDAFERFEQVLGDPEECDSCGAQDLTAWYENSCTIICEKCASRRRVPVIMDTQEGAPS